jgi:hypothetical protein
LVVKPIPTLPLSPPFDSTGTAVFLRDIRIEPLCNCGKSWWGIQPPPPCPVHGQLPQFKVWC